MAHPLGGLVTLQEGAITSNAMFANMESRRRSVGEGGLEMQLFPSVSTDNELDILVGGMLRTSCGRTQHTH